MEKQANGTVILSPEELDKVTTTLIKIRNGKNFYYTPSSNNILHCISYAHNSFLVSSANTIEQGKLVISEEDVTCTIINTILNK